MHTFSYEWFKGLEFSAIKDPGSAGNIFVDNMGIGRCELVTGGAEARTLRAPSRGGQIFTLAMKTDMGDCTVTVKDSAGNTTHTHVFNDAADFVTYIAIQSGTTLKWAVLAYSGLGAALTAQLTAITIADANSSPDYAIQSFTNSTAWGFAAEAELISFAYVVQNLQVRVAELEAIVEAAGLAKAN
jgi:hypothetical protein